VADLVDQAQRAAAATQQFDRAPQDASQQRLQPEFPGEVVCHLGQHIN